MAAKSVKELEEATDARFDRIEKLLVGLSEKLNPMQGLRPADQVVSPRRHLESEAMEDPNRGGTATIDLGDDGHAHIEQPAYVDVDSRVFQEHAAEMKFMEEMVTIDVHPTSTRGEKPIPFPVYCNGLMCVLTPGRQVTLPRKFVGVLVAARPVHYDNVEYERDGVKGVEHPSWRSPRFPFSIVHDTPKGMEWFRRVSAAP